MEDKMKTMTMFGRLSGAALTSHAKRQFEIARKSGEQIDQRKRRISCPDCDNDYATVGAYSTADWFLSDVTCFKCGYHKLTGGRNFGNRNARPESFRREGWYGPRAKEVKAETLRLVRVS
jgi:hypothetical protein